MDTCEFLAWRIVPVWAPVAPDTATVRDRDSSTAMAVKRNGLLISPC